MSRELLLKILEENKGSIISGNDLADRLSISRNAVWKAVHALKEEGHDIQSIKNKGYLLSVWSDALSDSEIRMNLNENMKKDLKIIILNETPSTNSYIKEHKALENNTLVLAKTQTKGRGRLGKSFHSLDQGGIYMSLLKTEDLSEYDTSLATLAAALAVSEVLDEELNESTRIKWVNDIYHNGYKLSGILTEGTLEFETGELSALVIGIGINVNTGAFPEEISDIASSLYQAAGKKFVRNEIIAKVISALDKYLLMTKKDSTRLIALYKEKMLYLGEEITVKRGNEEFSAYIKDLNEQGHLILMRNNEIMTLNSGEISIRKRVK